MQRTFGLIGCAAILAFGTLFAGTGGKPRRAVEAAIAKAQATKVAIENWIDPPPAIPSARLVYTCYCYSAPRIPIAYVIDGSGSMADDWDSVTRAVRRSMSELVDMQDVALIVARPDGPVEPLGPGLHPADEQGRRKMQDAIALLTADPGGGVDMAAAIELAMTYSPDHLFILSDDLTGRGRSEVDPAALLDRIDRFNCARKTTIHAIQPPGHPADPLMVDLAAHHGGKHRVMDGFE